MTEEWDPRRLKGISFSIITYELYYGLLLRICISSSLRPIIMSWVERSVFPNFMLPLPISSSIPCLRVTSLPSPPRFAQSVSPPFHGSFGRHEVARETAGECQSFLPTCSSEPGTDRSWQRNRGLDDMRFLPVRLRLDFYHFHHQQEPRLISHAFNRCNWSGLEGFY